MICYQCRNCKRFSECSTNECLVYCNHDFYHDEYDSCDFCVHNFCDCDVVISEYMASFDDTVPEQLPDECSGDVPF